MPSYTVRPATQRDAQAVADIHASAGAAVPAETGVAFWRDAIEYGEPQVQVVLDGGQIVGFAGFDRSRDKGSKPTVGEIWSICVIPGHWGKGAGLALWDAVREGLLEEGCTQVMAWLPLSSERALRFLELAGFKREMSSIKTVPMGGVKIEEIRLRRALS